MGACRVVIACEEKGRDQLRRIADVASTGWLIRGIINVFMRDIIKNYKPCARRLQPSGGVPMLGVLPA